MNRRNFTLLKWMLQREIENKKKNERRERRIKKNIGRRRDTPNQLCEQLRNTLDSTLKRKSMSF